MKISSTIIETNLGKIYIETINKSVVKLEWTNIKKIPKIETANTLLKNVKKQIIRYFNGEKIKFNIPVNPKGTKFQKKVWKYIQKINWGKKKSYNDISEKYGITIYEFEERYSDLNIWNNVDHIAYNNKSLIFSDEIAEMVLQEIIS